MEVAVLAGGLSLARHGGASKQRRDASVTPVSANRNLFETASSHLPRVLRESRRAPLPLRRMEAHKRTEKLAASPQLFESDFLNFFSRVHPADPGDRLRAGRRRDGVAGDRPRLRALATRPADARRGRHLDADRVLAAPARLPLGARQRARAQDALHHPRHPPRPPQRQAATGDAPGGGDPAGGSVLLRLHPAVRNAGRLPAVRRLHRAATSSTTTRTTTCTTSCRSRTWASACASSTCAITSRTTATDTASHPHYGMSSSEPCRAGGISETAQPHPCSWPFRPIAQAI